MEVNKFFITFLLVFSLCSCSNTSELETGEIKTLQLLKDAFDRSNSSKVFLDARNILSREQIDSAGIPILFVELASGQNGTLTPYPGRGVGQTWLGADGATITLERGIIMASRGMGDDIMGSSTFIPPWSKINLNTSNYSREISYLSGNNKITKRSFECKVQKINQKELIKIWGIKFNVAEFEETCIRHGVTITNNYYVDDKEIVRKSSQYHGETIGHITTERLDR